MSEPDVLYVRCEKNGATYGPKLTDGKIYVARHHRNRLYEIRDDLGHVRYIIPGERCPHMMSGPGWTGDESKAVGRWVVVQTFFVKADGNTYYRDADGAWVGAPTWADGSVDFDKGAPITAFDFDMDVHEIAALAAELDAIENVR